MTIECLQRELEAIHTEQYAHLVWKVMQITHNRPLSEDIVMDAYIQALEHYRSIQMSGALYSWLIKVAVRKAHYLMKRPHADVVLPTYDYIQDQMDWIDLSIKRMDVSEMLSASKDSLKKRDYLILWLRYWHGLSYAEIGQMLHMKPGAVRKAHQRVIERLRKRNEGVQMIF